MSGTWGILHFKCRPPQWVTHDPDQYVAIATQLASNIEALNHIRQNLHVMRLDIHVDEISFARK